MGRYIDFFVNSFIDIEHHLQESNGANANSLFKIIKVYFVYFEDSCSPCSLFNPGDLATFPASFKFVK